jgi:hypothetical protein
MERYENQEDFCVECGSVVSKYEIAGLALEAMCIKTNSEYGIWEEDNYWIRNNFKPLKATRDGEFVDIGEVIDEYMDFLENKDIYWETENLYSKIDSIIVTQKYPLLSQDYIATYYDTKFIQ